MSNEPKTKRDPEGTRRRIMAAATEEFAKGGLAGARVDQIARRAETNERMLYYYYGSKEGLFLAVLEKRAGLHLVSDDVFVNIAGGMSIEEPAVDLGIVAAVASSLRNRPIPQGTAVFGEVGLGEDLDAGGEALVGEDDDRGAVGAGDAGGLEGDVEAVLDVLRRQHDAGRVTMAAVDRLHQVALLNVGRHARRGSAALHVDH